MSGSVSRNVQNLWEVSQQWTAPVKESNVVNTTVVPQQLTCPVVWMPTSNVNVSAVPNTTYLSSQSVSYGSQQYVHVSSIHPKPVEQFHATPSEGQSITVLTNTALTVQSDIELTKERNHKSYSATSKVVFNNLIDVVANNNNNKQSTDTSVQEENIYPGVIADDGEKSEMIKVTSGSLESTLNRNPFDINEQKRAFCPNVERPKDPRKRRHVSPHQKNVCQNALHDIRPKQLDYGKGCSGFGKKKLRSTTSHASHFKDSFKKIQEQNEKQMRNQRYASTKKGKMSSQIKALKTDDKCSVSSEMPCKHRDFDKHLKLTPKRKEKKAFKHNPGTMAEKLDNLSKNTCKNDNIVGKLRKDELDYIKRQMNFSLSDVDKQQSKIAKKDGNQEEKRFQAKQIGLLPNVDNPYQLASVSNLSTQVASSAFPDSTSSGDEKIKSTGCSKQSILGPNALRDRTTREKLHRYALTIIDMVQAAEEKDTATKNEKQVDKHAEQNCTGTRFRVRLDVKKPILVGEELKLPSVPVQSVDLPNCTIEQHTTHAVQCGQSTADVEQFRKPKLYQKEFSDSQNMKEVVSYSQVTPLSATVNKHPLVFAESCISTAEHCGQHAGLERGLVVSRCSNSPQNNMTGSNETPAIVSTRMRLGEVASVAVKQHCQGYRAEPISFLPEPDYTDRDSRSLCKNCEAGTMIPIFENERLGVDPRPILSVKYQFILKGRCLKCFLHIKDDGSTVHHLKDAGYKNETTLRVVDAGCSNKSILKENANNTDSENLNFPSMDSKETIYNHFQTESSSLVVNPLTDSKATIYSISSNHNTVPLPLMGYANKQQYQIEAVKTNFVTSPAIRTDKVKCNASLVLHLDGASSVLVGKSNSLENYPTLPSDSPDNSNDSDSQQVFAESTKCITSPATSQKPVPQAKQDKSCVEVITLSNTVELPPEAALSEVESVDALRMKITSAKPFSDAETSLVQKCSSNLELFDEVADSDEGRRDGDLFSILSTEQCTVKSSGAVGSKESDKTGKYVKIHETFFNDAYSDISDNEKSNGKTEQLCDVNNEPSVSDIATQPAQAYDTSGKTAPADVRNFIGDNRCSSRNASINKERAEAKSSSPSNFKLPIFSKCPTKQNEAFNDYELLDAHKVNYPRQQKSDVQEVTSRNIESSLDLCYPDWMNDELPILQPKKKRQKIFNPPIIPRDKPSIGPDRDSTNLTGDQVSSHDFVKTQLNQLDKSCVIGVSTAHAACLSSSREQAAMHIKHGEVCCIPPIKANRSAPKVDLNIVTQETTSDVIQAESDVLIINSENQDRVDAELIGKSEVKRQCSYDCKESCLSTSPSLSEVQRNSLEGVSDAISDLQTAHVTSTIDSARKSLKETPENDEHIAEGEIRDSSAPIEIYDASVDKGYFTCRDEKYAWPYAQPTPGEVEAMSDCDSDIEWRSNLENVAVLVTALQDTGFVPKCFLHTSADHECCSCCGALCCASRWVRLADGTS